MRAFTERIWIFTVKAQLAHFDLVVAQEVPKKLTEKRDALAEFLFCLLIPLTFSLPSLS